MQCKFLWAKIAIHWSMIGCASLGDLIVQGWLKEERLFLFIHGLVLLLPQIDNGFQEEYVWIDNSKIWQASVTAWLINFRRGSVLDGHQSLQKLPPTLFGKKKEVVLKNTDPYSQAILNIHQGMPHHDRPMNYLLQYLASEMTSTKCYQGSEITYFFY